MKLGDVFQAVLSALQRNADLEGAVVVGVSGGLDSMVLMHAAVEAAGAGRVVVATFDHRLRAESAEDVAFVSRSAAALGCRVACGSGDVGESAKRDGQSLESVARACRYRFFAEVAGDVGASVVMTAHHADDQAETVLFNLLRGGGMEALSGMVERSPMPYADGVVLLRPLLKLRKAVLREAAAATGIGFREDPSNALADFTRNRLRNEALPLLNDILSRDVAPLLVRSSEVIAEESAWLGDLADRALGELRRNTAQHQGLDLAGCRELPQVLRRRLLHRWLTSSGVAEVSRRDVLAVEAVVMAEDKPAKVNLKGCLCARRRAGRVFLARQ